MSESSRRNFSNVPYTSSSSISAEDSKETGESESAFNLFLTSRDTSNALSNALSRVFSSDSEGPRAEPLSLGRRLLLLPPRHGDCADEPDDCADEPDEPSADEPSPLPDGADVAMGSWGTGCGTESPTPVKKQKVID